MSDQPTTNLSQADIDLHVRAKEVELRLGSRLVAGVVCAVMSAFLAFSSEFTGLGGYSTAWLSAIGFLVGTLLGERMIFTLLGALIATQLLQVSCT